ncbi:MAG TPA: hypothetical protein VD770_00200 [Coxiellaceae bacterium]|nr:hypothetical protein [Coxiellaceae bacterium]
MKKLSLLAALTFSSFCSLAQADPLYSGTIDTADHGFILSAEGGYGWLLGTPDDPMDSTIGGTHDVGGFVWGANIGYAWPMDAISAWGLEIGYADNGENKYTGNLDNKELKIVSDDIQLLGSFNSIWESGINFFFKLGGAVIRQKATSTGPIINGTLIQSFNTTDYYVRPMMVIGVGYKITPSINLYVEASGIYGELNTKWSSVGTSESSINNASAVVAFKAGLSYAFSE